MQNCFYAFKCLQLRPFIQLTKKIQPNHVAVVFVTPVAVVRLEHSFGLVRRLYKWLMKIQSWAL